MSDEGSEGDLNDVDIVAPLPEGPFLTGSASYFRGSQSVGTQTWSIEYGQWEIEAADAAHSREQEKKDNDLRRLCVRVFLGLLVLAVLASGVYGFVLDDQVGTRRRYYQLRRGLWFGSER